jgi:hypothetical protein
VRASALAAAAISAPARAVPDLARDLVREGADVLEQLAEADGSGLERAEVVEALAVDHTLSCITSTPSYLPSRKTRW